MTLTLELSADLEQRLHAAAQAQGLPDEQYALQVLHEKLAIQDRKRQEAIAMLRAWREEEGDPDEERQAYDELTKALDEDRLSYRKLFPPELKGISW